MTPEYLVGLFLLASSLAWTPGPNNALLASSGARFGYRPTLPHILGVVIGFPLMQFVLWMGLGSVFLAFPILRELLRFGGAAMLLWIGWQIATAPYVENAADAAEAGKPWTFLQGFAFQWINPKAWVMVISLAGNLPETSPFWLSPFLGSLVFFLAGVFSANGWALIGTALQRAIHTPLRFRIFSLVMAGLIVLTVIGILAADLSA